MSAADSQLYPTPPKMQPDAFDTRYCSVVPPHIVSQTASKCPDTGCTCHYSHQRRLSSGTSFDFIAAFIRIPNMASAHETALLGTLLGVCSVSSTATSSSPRYSTTYVGWLTEHRKSTKKIEQPSLQHRCSIFFVYRAQCG